MATAVMPLGGGGPAAGPAAPEQPSLILITTVDIGDGKSDLIEVRQGDDPADLARAFVAKHGLPPAITDALAQHLRDNLREAGQAARGGDGGRNGSLSARGQYNNGSLSARSDGSRTAEDAAVFERLYQQAMVLRQRIEEKKQRAAMEEDAALESARYQRSWISQAMMRERTSGPYENYGEMLYKESLEGAARRRQKADRQRAQRAAAELSSATFTPEITRMAQQMRYRKEGAGGPAWQRLSKGMKPKTAERMDSLRKEKEEAETRECTFRPALCKRSDKLMAERTDTFRTLNVTAHQQLYQDSLRRQQKQEAYSNWFPEDVTFQPKLVAAQRSAGALAKGYAAGGDEVPRIERLYASYEKLQCKLSEARAKLALPQDPATGRALYKPQTGRGPSFTRHTPEQGVGEYLHALQSERDEKARQRKEEEARREGEARCMKKTVATTDAMVRRLQRSRFAQVFEFLDKECRGALDLAAIAEEPPACLEELDDDVRVDLEAAAHLALRGTVMATSKNKSPDGTCHVVALELDASMVPLKLFCALMEEAIAARPFPRPYLTPAPPQRDMPVDTFAPVIDERSKQLAAKLRPKDTPYHELLYRDATNISAKKAALRAAVDDATMGQCTFTPKLVSEQIVQEGLVMKTLRQGALPLSASQLPAGGAAASPSSSPACSAAAAGVEPAASAEDSSEREVEGEGSAYLLGGLSELKAQLDAAAAEAGGCGTGRINEGCEEACGDEEEEEEQEGEMEEIEEEIEGDLEGDLVEDFEEDEELEAEVEAMLEATSAAAAAAERLTGESDQRYLSKILGLTQEAVDAMEPAISSLPGWEARASRGGASAPASRGGASGDLHTGAAEEAPAASACWLVPNHEPLISPAVANGAGAGSAPGSPAHTSLFSVPFKAPEPEGACGSEAEAE